jgi:hypothetical protein
VKSVPLMSCSLLENAIFDSKSDKSVQDGGSDIPPASPASATTGSEGDLRIRDGTVQKKKQVPKVLDDDEDDEGESEALEGGRAFDASGDSMGRGRPAMSESEDEEDRFDVTIY